MSGQQLGAATSLHSQLTVAFTSIIIWNIIVKPDKISL
jgi:hypothetical protein